MSERSAEISAAAKELIIEAGGSLPTIRQIAARSFLSPAAIYVHFPNFDAIVDDVRQGVVVELLLAIRASQPSSGDEVIAATASWMVSNKALVVACTAGHYVPPVKVVEMVNEALVACGYPTISPHLVQLGIQLLAPVPLLMNELDYGADELAKYLHAMLVPMQTVSALPPIEVIHA